MLRVLRVELLKMQWLLVGSLVVAGPCLAVLMSGDSASGAEPWARAYLSSVLQYAWLFYPLLAGVFAALLCRTEHAGGGWKQMLSLPVSRTSVYFAKYVMLAGLLALTNLVFGAAFVAAGTLAHFEGGVPWEMLGRSLLAGWIAVLPLAAIQLWVSSRWKSFGAALALNVCFTLPSIFAAQSHEFAPWYPWAQPMLAMMPGRADIAAGNVFNVAPETLWVVIVGGLMFALLGGLVTFARADLKS
ncbi:MAG: ABC transporter permease subunit [Coriobacteriia bacterium]|nr:ABC transporter permease subunit [Coriobacteriia bacterium]